MYFVTQLENGLRVATVEMPHMTSVSVGLWIGVGSRHEPAAMNGICHFIEHLLFKGTRKRSAREISEAVEGVGGYLNAFTSEEATCIHARAAHDYFDDLLDVLVDMLLHSKFDPVDLAKEREVIKEEIAMYMDQPQHQVQEILNATLWPAQPLGRPITGTNRTLDGISRQALVEFLRRHYAASTIVISAAGKIKHHQVVRAVKRYARGIKTGPAPQFDAAKAGQSKPAVRLISKRTEQTQIALGIRACSRHDPRRYALRLLNAILGENSSSRLFQVVREDLGLAYSIYSAPSFFEDTGDLVISVGLDTENVPRALRLIFRELSRLARGPVGSAELRRARDYLCGQIDLGQESTDNQMNWIGEQLLGYGRLFRPTLVKRRLRETTSGDIRAAAADFFRPQHLNLALVSPLKSTEGLRRSIRL